MKFIDQIKDPMDLKDMNINQLEILATEIREFLLDSVSKTGGHLSSNLGTVEIIIALHRVYNSPKDKIIFDVGHQAYTHKILTGRKELMSTLRTKDGISGFLKRSESEHDHFGAGHASTSISAAYGFAKSARLSGSNSKTVAFIGDGSFTGGMAFEALNLIGEQKEDVLIVLNDNNMSIDKNVGGLQQSLSELRAFSSYNRAKSKAKAILPTVTQRGISRVKNAFSHFFIPSTVFEGFGIRYFGPFDGHDLSKLIPTIERLKNLSGPKVLHIITKKGKGYNFAELEPDHYHGVGSFEPTDGLLSSSKETYSSVFGKKMMDLAYEDKEIVAITAAMPTGTGLKNFSEEFPERFIDVGIAEENAVTLAAAMALDGRKPFVAIYSTFLQRGFDQLLHDVCIQNAPVVFCLDRSGIVGNDGATHQGIYDLSYLSILPNMRIFAPKDGFEFRRMLEFAKNTTSPMAIKYPRDSICEINEDMNPINQAELILSGTKTNQLVISYGRTIKELCEIQKDLKFDILNMRCLQPIDWQKVNEIKDNYKTILVIEENVYTGSLGQKMKAVDQRFITKCLPDGFIEHGQMEEVLEDYGLKGQALRDFIQENA